VLVVVDALVHVVGFVIELFLVFLREMPVVGGHIFLFVVLQAGFSVLEVRSLGGRDFAAADSIRDTFLLMGFAAVHLVYARMTGIDDTCSGSGVVVV
jgi:hypothetical protein